MKLSRRKILTVISAVIILAVLLTAAAVGLWIWYWPMRWNQEFQNSYLLRNQPAFRTAGITPGNFNKLLLSQVELGPSGKELFCAPNGSITLSILDNKNWNAPHFRVLQLDNCNIKLHTRNRQIYLNNYLLADFLQAISALPP